ncbi:MAG: PEP/pyruvate-binding domain-containing protein [Bacillota bacterium]|nr:PEP/pyruvate-binding domain-containing protein [Bacillota bacterium]
MKAVQLERMQAQGIPVPPFRVLTFDILVPDPSPLLALLGEGEAARRHAQADFNSDRIAAYSERLVSELRRQFRASAAREHIRRLLEELSQSAPSPRFAVRSSASVEDGADHSFAGIFETLLDQPAASVEAAVEHCLCSLYAPRALEYAHLNDIPTDRLRMDILIQRMAEGSLSGILFTANPRGVLSESVLTVGRGRGDLVVSDRIDTTSYFYHRYDDLLDWEGEPLLSHEQMRALIALGDRILETLALPHADIEFVIEGDRIEILQARPITGLSAGHPVVYDNSNIVESYPGITLPLTISFAKEIYSGVFRGVSSRVLKSDRLLRRIESVFPQMVGDVNGRMYYRIDNWYRVLEYLPFRRRVIPVWQEMLGVKNKTYRPSEGVPRGWTAFRIHLNFLFEFFRVPRNMRMLDRRFQAIEADFRARFREDLPLEQMKELYDEIRAQLLSIWDITLLNDMVAFLYTGLLKRSLKKRHPEDFEERALGFMKGAVQIESMKPLRALDALASTYAQDPDAPATRAAMAEYIDRYGDRTVEELKLETRTLRSHPERLIPMLRDRYEATTREAGGSAQARGGQVCDPAPHPTALEAGAGFWSGFWTRFFAKRALLGIRNRETSRLHRSRIFGFVRSISRAFGARFAREGILDDADDVFYLTLDEMFGAIERGSAGERHTPPGSQAHLSPESDTRLPSEPSSGHPSELPSEPASRPLRLRVAERKARFAAYREMPAYSRIVLSEEDVPVAARRFRPPVRENAMLYGTGCSGGQIEGELILVHDASVSIASVRDKIIVSRMTDPGWIFLLASAKGIITEKGSLLSHTAIVSRELGIPAVVGVPHAMDQLQTGDYVRLDGARGTIETIPADTDPPGENHAT